MTTPPYLIEKGDELFLDVSVGQQGRRRLALSDRASALLVDDLEYDNRDVVPWLTARTLVLAGGAYLRNERADNGDLVWSLTGADGGRKVTDGELELLGDYLTSVEVDQHAVETARDHVRSTRLSEVVSPEDVRGTHARTRGLREIAKDL